MRDSPVVPLRSMLLLLSSSAVIPHRFPRSPTVVNMVLVGGPSDGFWQAKAAVVQAERERRIRNLSEMEQREQIYAAHLAKRDAELRRVTIDSAKALRVLQEETELSMQKTDVQRVAAAAAADAAEGAGVAAAAAARRAERERVMAQAELEASNDIEEREEDC